MTETLLAPTVPTPSGLPSGLTFAPTGEQAEALASVMAQQFADATAAIRRHLRGLREATAGLHAAFDVAGQPSGWNDFTLHVHHDGRRHGLDDDDIQRVVESMNRRGWRILMDKIGIKSIMGVAQREKFEAQLDKGELPPITAEAILDVLSGLSAQARDFAETAAREVCDYLRPHRSKYKSNSAFRIGRRVVLAHTVERGYPGRWRVQYHKEQHLTALDAVFHLLDGRGVLRDKGPLRLAIESATGGTCETEFFRGRMFNNGNLHLTFRRLDLVVQLNGKATGAYVLGDEEV